MFNSTGFPQTLLTDEAEQQKRMQEFSAFLKDNTPPNQPPTETTVGFEGDDTEELSREILACKDKRRLAQYLGLG